MNVWCGIWNNGVSGPSFTEGILFEQRRLIVLVSCPLEQCEACGGAIFKSEYPRLGKPAVIPRPSRV